MNARPVSFRNTAGHLLRAVLEEPPAGARIAPCAAVLLSAGVKARVGPHRLYRKLSRAFLARGMPVLRVDFHGFGDSEGELPEDRLDRIYREVELGRHVDDACCALDWLEAECGTRRAVVGGLCGAAITALLAAPRDSRVAGLYAIGLPVELQGSEAPREAALTRGELRFNAARYLIKLTSVQAWLRLLRGKSDFGLMRRMLGSMLSRDEQAALAEGLNPKFGPAFLHLIGSGRPALMIFGERDPLSRTYHEKFLSRWAEALAPYGALVSTEVIPRANHVLSDPAWVAAATRATGAWLDAHFGARAAEAAPPAAAMPEIGLVRAAGARPR